MSGQSSFLLSKWYLDCVSDAGDVFIGYAALLQWKAFALKYSSALERRKGRPTEVRTSLVKFTAPQITDSSILHWSSDSLGIDGTWKALSAPVERTLFESDAGEIKWRCLHPLAAADIYIGKERRLLSGLGYAEHISITIAPWQLPIEELRWGRFLSESDSLVWIDWRGPHPLRLVLRNGIEAETAEVNDSEIILDKGRVLKLEEKQILREGALIDTALSVIPGIGKILPLRSLNTYECKWRSRGFLEDSGTPVSEGWAIHEIVRWV